MFLADLHEPESQLLGINDPEGVVGVAVEERLHHHPRLSLPHQLLLQQLFLHKLLFYKLLLALMAHNTS